MVRTDEESDLMGEGVTEFSKAITINKIFSL